MTTSESLQVINSAQAANTATYSNLYNLQWSGASTFNGIVWNGTPAQIYWGDPYTNGTQTGWLPNNPVTLPSVETHHHHYHEKESPKEVVPMKKLYGVVVVTLDGDVILDKKVVAESNDEAAFMVDVHKCLKDHKLTPKDVTVLYNTYGDVKVRPEPQKVKVVKED